MVIFASTGYWASIGTLMLIYLTYQDFKHNRKIDDRKNYLMFGVTLSLFSHIDITLWYLGATILSVIIMSALVSKFAKGLGAGDVSAIGWIYYGLTVLQPGALIGFIVLLAAIGLLHVTVKEVILKIKQPVPFFHVILITFVSTALLFGLY